MVFQKGIAQTILHIYVHLFLLSVPNTGKLVNYSFSKDNVCFDAINLSEFTIEFLVWNGDWWKYKCKNKKIPHYRTSWLCKLTENSCCSKYGSKKTLKNVSRWEEKKIIILQSVWFFINIRLIVRLYDFLFQLCRVRFLCINCLLFVVLYSILFISYCLFHLYTVP